MKKIQPLIIAMLALALAGANSGCKNKEKAAKPKDEQLVNQYCSGPEYFSDEDYFRANAVGESMDQATAKKKARSNALANLASSIQTTIQGTIDNYVNSREMNNTEQVEERFESLTREVIDQELKGVKTICDKLTQQESTSNYKSYLALELSGQELIGKMNERLGNDERLKIDYDYEQFKDTFDKEMQKLKNK